MAFSVGVALALFSWSCALKPFTSGLGSQAPVHISASLDMQSRFLHLQECTEARFCAENARNIMAHMQRLQGATDPDGHAIMLQVRFRWNAKFDSYLSITNVEGTANVVHPPAVCDACEPVVIFQNIKCRYF